MKSTKRTFVNNENFKISPLLQKPRLKLQTLTRKDFFKKMKNRPAVCVWYRLCNYYLKNNFYHSMVRMVAFYNKEDFLKFCFTLFHYKNMISKRFHSFSGLLLQRHRRKNSLSKYRRLDNNAVCEISAPKWH